MFAAALLAAALAAVPAHPRLVADANDFAALGPRLEKTELGRLARTRLIKEADTMLGYPLPVYKKDASGRRILHTSRAMVDIIGKTAMAYRLTGDGRYAKKAVEQAMAVSRFKDWNPSHFLDTAEMTFAVAMCYDWLYDTLTEDERETLGEAILHKGLLDEKGELSEGWWTDHPNNWCQVCHGGLVAGAIAIAEREPQIARRVIDRAVKCLPTPMALFAPDGGFPEGPTGYWPFAMEYNVLAIWAIEKFDGMDHGLCSLPGFAAEVDYLNALTGPSGATFNHSDAGSYALDFRGSDYPQWWLAKRFNRPDTLAFCEAAALRRYFDAPIGAGPNERSFNRFYPFLLLCLDEPADAAPPVAPLARVIGGVNPVAVMRTSWTDPNAWYAGMKGGRPSCSHGHMDVGSFVLEADGVRWVHDLGCETYAKVESSEIGQDLWNQLQNSRRWNLFRYATRGHGTLQFGDEQQNVEATASFEPLVCGDGETSVTLDMSKTYGRKVARTFALGAAGGFTVADAISGAKPGEKVTWRINTFANAKASGNVAVLTATNAAGEVRRLKVTAEPKDVAFAVVGHAKREHDYEMDTPGLKQLVFTRTVPASGELAFKVTFERQDGNVALADAEDKLRAQLPAIFAKAAAHYRALDAAATPLMRAGEKVEGLEKVKCSEKADLYIPQGWLGWQGKQELDMRSIFWWTSGHYAGSLWYLYEATGDAFFRDRATVWTEILEPNKTADTNHDLGFIVYCSFGNARRLLKTDKYDAIIAETAKTLSGRFSDKLGLIRSWGEVTNAEEFLVIPDNMMNLELLEAAAQMTGDARFDKIARSHATNTMAHHFRADGGTYHVLDYDQKTGRVQGIKRGQGAGCTSAWSRGQSWAVYGYTMMYRMTRDKAYLDFAQKVTDFAIENPNMPEDGVPYWDFGAPGEERDSSAAAVMASGLLELADFVGGEKGASYRAFAVKQLTSLASDAYFSQGGEVGHFLLKHGVGHKPAGTEVDTPLNYGDYYFLEALVRFGAQKEKSK